MIEYKLVSRKPNAYKVKHEDRVAIVQKTGIADRACRWQLFTSEGGGVGFFPSRRAAFYFFEYGKKFTTNPVMQKHGRNQGQRIR